MNTFLLHCSFVLKVFFRLLRFLLSLWIVSFSFLSALRQGPTNLRRRVKSNLNGLFYFPHICIDAWFVCNWDVFRCSKNKTIVYADEDVNSSTDCWPHAPCVVVNEILKYVASSAVRGLTFFGESNLPPYIRSYNYLAQSSCHYFGLGHPGLLWIDSQPFVSTYLDNIELRTISYGRMYRSWKS